MFKLIVLFGLLLVSKVAAAGGVAVCSDSSKVGQDVFTCLHAFTYQTVPNESLLVLTCQSSSIQPGLQNMAHCPTTVWKQRSTLVASELVGYCDQDQMDPYQVCDWPNGREGWRYARDVLNLSTTTPPPAPPPGGVTGPAVLRWTAPTVNDAGSPITVTGYRIEYGQTNFAQTVTTSSTSHTLTLPAGAWQFRVVALASSGESVPTASVTATIPVTSSPPAATPRPTVSLSASPTSIASGSGTTLTWSSTNATSCSGVGSSTSGSILTTPPMTTTFTQTCSGAGGQATATTVVTVTAAAATSWRVAGNGSNSTRSVYEAVMPLSGATLVRGNADGTIAVGKTCGAEVFKEGTTSYRSISNSDAQLRSPTYANRQHVAVCVNR